MSRERVVVNEVGPRDGLQNQPKTLAPEERVQLIRALFAAGLDHIEAGSFVSPKAVPQMAGAEEVSAALPRQAGRSRIGLVLNLRGWDRARFHAMGVRSDTRLVVTAPRPGSTASRYSRGLISSRLHVSTTE